MKEKPKCPSCGKVLYNEESKACRKHKEFSAIHRKRLGDACRGDKSANWKGDDVGRIRLHVWLRKYLTKPKLCQECNRVPPYDLANKGIYNREFKNWEWLCRKCHMLKDGRLEKLKEMGRANGFLERISCFVCKKVFKPRSSKVRHCSQICANITNSRKRWPK